MKAEKYNVVAAKVVGVESAELPDGVDAVLLVRSDLERHQMHSALVALQNDAFVRTWPPTAADGGDKRAG